MIQKKINSYSIIALLSIFSIVSYYFLAFHTPRSSFIQLIAFYSLSFLCFILFLNSSFKYKFQIGILYRMLFLLVLPFLSQDYYRFIWDGRLISNDINPYLFIPKSIIESLPLGISSPEVLYNGMGALSAENFSNYPPLNQFIFAVAGFFSPKSLLGAVFILRTFIVSADIGIYILGRKILQSLNLNVNNIYFYFLNPLVIIELTGNLHFEGVMLFLLCGSLYYLLLNRNWISAIFFGASVLLKILPILILPMFWAYFGNLKSFLKYVIIVFLVTVLGFSFFMDSQLIANYSKTVGLWMSKFEFNASLYYVFREFGFWLSGYNQIKILGKLALFSIVLYNGWVIYFKKPLNLQDLIKCMLLGLTLYFLMSTTVHPWYIVSLVFLAVFTDCKYVYLWSFTVFFSYWAYSNPSFKENYVILALEYIPVLGLFSYEVLSRERLSS